MKACVLHSYDAPMTVDEVTVSDPIGDELLIRVVASGVCHSDKTIRQGTQQHPLPMILGHEAAGVVERVGPDATVFQPGDRVVTSASAMCGVCEWCMRGAPQHCLDRARTRAADLPPRLSLHGTPVAALVGLGGFAELMLVSQRAAAPLPAEVPLEIGALLGCAVVTGMGAVFNTAKVRPGESVAVIGCGGVGLNVIQAARVSGAGRIVAVDRVREKLARAEEFGATDTVLAADTDPVEAVRDLTGGGVDHAFEVVGNPATVAQAFAMLRIRGTATVVGVPKPTDVSGIPIFDFLLEKRLQGSRMGSSNVRLDIARIGRLYLDRRIHLDSLISHRIGLEDVESALAGMADATGARSVIALDE